MSGQLSWPEDPKDAVAVGEHPKHVRAAAILMYIGAVLALPSLVKLLFTPRGELEQQARDSLKRAKQPITDANIDTWISQLTLLVVIVTVVSVLLWIAMGLLNSRGYSWARWIATLLAVANVFLTLASPPLSYVALASILVGLTAAGLLWTPQSRQWFAGKNRRV
jgi:O-antigen/teichoic acid export membrane protein